MNAISKTIAVVALFGVSQALLVSPAAAKTVTLSCRTEQGPATYTLRIDYSSGLVEEINDSGSAYTGAATANISDNAIVWSTDYPSSYLSGDNVRHETTAHWEGRLDRLAGTGWFRRYFEDLYHNDPVSVSCREAAPVF